MKPMNFPLRKRARQRQALQRIYARYFVSLHSEIRPARTLRKEIDREISALTATLAVPEKHFTKKDRALGGKLSRFPA